MEFDALYEKLMLEMARPISKPLLAGREVTDRYIKLLDLVGKYLKFGKGTNGEDLIDTDGNPAPGLGDSVLQHRKYLYFFACLINQKNPKLAYTYAREFISKNGYPDYNGGAKYNLKIATDLYLRDNPNILFSEDFTSRLFDSDNMADFINSTRVTSNSQSVKAAKNKESHYNMGISDIHDITAKTRTPSRT
jgi:hypothetical protein